MAKLPYVVEVRHPPCMAYEPIAAFNVQSVAERYALKCALNNGLNGLDYRVRYRRNVLKEYEGRKA